MKKLFLLLLLICIAANTRAEDIAFDITKAKVESIDKGKVTTVKEFEYFPALVTVTDVNIKLVQRGNLHVYRIIYLFVPKTENNITTYRYNCKNVQGNKLLIVLSKIDNSYILELNFPETKWTMN